MDADTYKHWLVLHEALREPRRGPCFLVLASTQCRLDVRGLGLHINSRCTHPGCDTDCEVTQEHSHLHVWGPRFQTLQGHRHRYDGCRPQREPLVQGPTDKVAFSLDEGQCWHDIQLAEAIDVDNIRYTAPTPLTAMLPGLQTGIDSVPASRALKPLN